MWRFRVAESAPPVAGMLQLERSKRTKAQVRWRLFGPTLSVVLPPEAVARVLLVDKGGPSSSRARQRAGRLRQVCAPGPEMPGADTERRGVRDARGGRDRDRENEGEAPHAQAPTIAY